MFQQPQFQFPIHSRENSRSNEAILKENKKRLSANCRTIYDHLMNGGTITCLLAAKEFNMGELRRRIKDLRDVAKVRVSDRMIEGKCKEWYMTPEDIEFNKSKMREAA